MDRAEKAAQFFLSGYNCAQSVAMAFADLIGADEATAAKMTSGFGGGFGRQREVCGAVSGMTLVAGCLYGYDAPNPEKQKFCYALIQDLCRQFREQTGSIICRELLENPTTDPTPSPRTAQYYKQRPCARMVMVAAQILDKYISEHTS